MSAPDNTAAGEAAVMGADGEFHAVDDAVDLSGTTTEAWIALALFWLLGLTVFYQFFTRYVLNDSAAWTEEIARYFLIATVFVGAAIGVAKNNHIHVDFLYRYLPGALGRTLSFAVDGFRVAFFGAMVVYTVQMMLRMQNYKMTIIDVPVNVVYAFCLLGFAAMFVRALQVTRIHWKQGYSVLERPEAALEGHV